VQNVHSITQDKILQSCFRLAFFVLTKYEVFVTNVKHFAR